MPPLCLLLSRRVARREEEVLALFGRSKPAVLPSCLMMSRRVAGRGEEVLVSSAPMSSPWVGECKSLPVQVLPGSQPAVVMPRCLLSRQSGEEKLCQCQYIGLAVGGRVQAGLAGACWSYLGRNRQWCCRGASCLVSLERGSFVSANKARCGWASASSCCLLVLPDQVVAAVIKGGHANNLRVVGVFANQGFKGLLQWPAFVPLGNFLGLSRYGLQLRLDRCPVCETSCQKVVRMTLRQTSLPLVNLRRSSNLR